MTDGKLARYVGYAAGEILLVVIGILIALQINDWAEDRKDRAFEKKTLAQIQRNLEQDYAALDEILVNRRDALQSIDNILAIDDPDTASDDLGKWLVAVIHFDRFNSITNAYEVLKSRGLDLVRKDELRLELGIYYDGWAREILDHNQDLERSFFDFWMPKLLSDFESFEWGQVAEPIDQAAFLSDRLIRTALRIERGNHEGAADNVEKMMRVNARLREGIAIEIGD